MPARTGTAYKSLIPESIGNFSFNLGGILEFPIVLAIAFKQVEALAVLVIIQAAFMAGYRVFMVIAQGLLRVRPRPDALTSVPAAR